MQKEPNIKFKSNLKLVLEKKVNPNLVKISRKKKFLGCAQQSHKICFTDTHTHNNKNSVFIWYEFFMFFSLVNYLNSTTSKLTSLNNLVTRPFSGQVNIHLEQVKKCRLIIFFCVPVTKISF